MTPGSTTGLKHNLIFRSSMYWCSIKLDFLIVPEKINSYKINSDQSNVPSIPYNIVGKNTGEGE